MTLRFVLTLLHRWVGLVIAGFLFMSGITGAIISWDHELDDLLNAHLTETDSTGPQLPALELVRIVEERDPRVEATFFTIEAEAGEAPWIFVEPRIDPATGVLYDIGYNQAFLDPATGAEIGRRHWGAAWPVTSENLISFLYVLHYSLHIPTMWGIDHWGIWLMGIIAVLWTLDCFVGFYLTLPSRRADPTKTAEAQFKRGFVTRWAPAWKIKTSGSGYRINFDIHRAFGLWVWGLLFMLAFTAFSLNLYREAFYPVMSLVSEVTPTPFDLREPKGPNEPIPAKIGFAPILERAAAEAAQRGWPEPLGSIFYTRDFGIYGVRFFHPGDDHGSAGVGPPTLYYDGADGRYLGDREPWKGTVADIFVQAQFPLHSGRILGLPGRILVSIMGLVTAALSVTGVIIWQRKRPARILRSRNRATLPSPAE